MVVQERTKNFSGPRNLESCNDRWKHKTIWDSKSAASVTVFTRLLIKHVHRSSQLGESSKGRCGFSTCPYHWDAVVSSTGDWFERVDDKSFFFLRQSWLVSLRMAINSDLRVWLDERVYVKWTVLCFQFCLGEIWLRVLTEHVFLVQLWDHLSAICHVQRL